jgi:hypothetical protein
MKKVLLAIGVLFTLAGLMMGFGYLLYCQFASGAGMGEYPLFEQDITRIAVGRASVGSTSAAKWSTPVTISLEPEMNPVAFNITGKVLEPVRSIRKEARYTTSFSLGSEVIWQEDFRINKKRGKNSKDKKPISIKSVGTGLSSTSQHLRTFSVADKGEYTFDISHKGGDLEVASLLLKVRRNVMIANKSIYIPGFVMLAAGIIGLVVSGRMKRGLTEPL